MTATFNTLRIDEVFFVDAHALDQADRPGFMQDTDWVVDGENTIAGDPTTRHAIASSSVANPTHITTFNAHGYATGDRVRIFNHVSPVPDIDGPYTVTVLSPTVFTIPVNVSSAGGSSGWTQRANGDVAVLSDGPPPNRYSASVTGKASGAGRIVLRYSDAFGVQALASKPFTVLNASTFDFVSPHIDARGVLIFDMQNGTGPGEIQITAVPVDSRGDEIGAPAYVVSSWAWSDPSGHLSLNSGTSTGTVSLNASSRGDGLLMVAAVNSAGNTITGGLPYQVISTSSVVLEAD